MPPPNLPPTRRKRPRDKPLTQPHELEGISPRGVIIFVVGLFVGAFVAMWIGEVVVICLQCGRSAYFIQGIRFKHIWRLSNGQPVRGGMQAVFVVVWTLLMWIWKTVSLVIIQTV